MPLEDGPRHPTHLPAKRRMMVRRISLIAKTADHNDQPHHQGGQHHQQNLMTTPYFAEGTRNPNVQDGPLSISPELRKSRNAILNPGPIQN